jgi:hypothetical protein
VGNDGENAFSVGLAQHRLELKVFKEQELPERRGDHQLVPWQPSVARVAERLALEAEGHGFERALGHLQELQHALARDADNVRVRGAKVRLLHLGPEAHRGHDLGRAVRAPQYHRPVRRAPHYQHLVAVLGKRHRLDFRRPQLGVGEHPPPPQRLHVVKVDRGALSDGEDAAVAGDREGTDPILYGGSVHARARQSAVDEGLHASLGVVDNCAVPARVKDEVFIEVL